MTAASPEEYLQRAKIVTRSRPAQVKGAVPVLTEGQMEGLLAAVAHFQQEYLGATLGRMSDSVSGAFTGGNRALPTSAELQRLIGCAPALTS